MHHGINGFMYCTMPPARFKVGTIVRWIHLSIGSEEGTHSPVFTGQVRSYLLIRVRMRPVLATASAVVVMHSCHWAMGSPVSGPKLHHGRTSLWPT